MSDSAPTLQMVGFVMQAHLVKPGPCAERVVRVHIMLGAFGSRFFRTACGIEVGRSNPYYASDNWPTINGVPQIMCSRCTELEALLRLGNRVRACECAVAKPRAGCACGGTRLVWG